MRPEQTDSGPPLGGKCALQAFALPAKQRRRSRFLRARPFETCTCRIVNQLMSSSRTCYVPDRDRDRERLTAPAQADLSPHPRALNPPAPSLPSSDMTSNFPSALSPGCLRRRAPCLRMIPGPPLRSTVDCRSPVQCTALLLGGGFSGLLEYPPSPRITEAPALWSPSLYLSLLFPSSSHHVSNLLRPRSPSD